MDYRVVSPLLSFQQRTSLHSVTYPLLTERLTNSTNHSPPWDENRRPGGKEFIRFCGIRRFIAVFTTRY